MKCSVLFVGCCALLMSSGCASNTAKPKTGAATSKTLVAKRIAVVKASFAAYNAGKLETAQAAFEANATWEMVGAGPKGKLAGKVAITARLKQERGAFPDAKLTPVRIFAIGDRLIVQGVWTGTHKGAMGSIKPTNKPAGVLALHIFTFRGNKVTQLVTAFDPVSVMRQLGVMPAGPMPVGPPLTAPNGNVQIVVAARSPANEATYTKMQNAKPKEMAALLADNTVGYGPGGRKIGKPQMIGMLKAMRVAFPDTKGKVAWVVSAGDWVIGRMTMTGTHTGPMGPLKATNKPIAVEMLDVARYSGGKVVEGYSYHNKMQTLRQLGLLKMAAPKAPIAK